MPKFFDAPNTSMPMIRPFFSRSMITFSASSSLMSYLAFLSHMYMASAFWRILFVPYMHSLKLFIRKHVCGVQQLKDERHFL